MTKFFAVLATASLGALVAVFAPAPVARADIFEWEYINPANPSLGKQPSTTLTPDGAGAIAQPGANLTNRNLTKAYLIGASLNGYWVDGGEHTSGSFVFSDLSGTNFSQADLTNASLYVSYLTGAILTDAEVRGADFTREDNSYPGSGITIAQLYSTASYKTHDLTGIRLFGNDLTGANLAGQNLANASLVYATLTGANLTGAEIRGASFSRDGAQGSGAGLTPAQLYSTASYQAHDLSGIGLSGNYGGANLVGQNLTNSQLGNALLTNGNLSQANLTNAYFAGATLTGANLTGAEVRGADFRRLYASGPGGITAAQLSSTASYLAHDLTGVLFDHNNLSGVNLAGQILTNASFTQATLTNANFSQTNLSNFYFGGTTLNNANFSQANLTNAYFASANLTGANLTGAEIRGANFSYSPGISKAQLYSTASYQAHDLSGISVNENDLRSGNFDDQNLTNASLRNARLNNASFSQANLTNASLWSANLTNANLSQANLTNADLEYAYLPNANLSQANLSNAIFKSATLTNANLTGAEIRANFSRTRSGGDFIGSGISLAQLYSTASYLAHDLSGITLDGNNLAGVNLAGQNLTNANVPSHAVTVSLTGANLSGADARGANFQYASLDGANTSNLIQSNGHIAGLDLAAAALLVVRDYDGNPAAYPTPTGPLPIVVDEHLAMNATGTLRLVFDADAWDSTISFAPGIPVALGGTLDLSFAPGIDVAAQSGRTIDLFDWTGVTPTGAFTVSSPYTWNLANLYTTGEVTLSPLLAGDYNGNGTVGPEDYDLWKANFGSMSNLAADGNGDGRINAADYTVWRNNLGATLVNGVANAEVPEPATLVLLIVGVTASLTFRRAAASGRIARGMRQPRYPQLRR